MVNLMPSAWHFTLSKGRALPDNLGNVVYVLKMEPAADAGSAAQS